MQVNLVLIKKDGSLKPFKLSNTVVTIGRRQDCDLCIPLSVVSRKHCELYFEQGRLMVRDLGSRNGTYLNGQRIEESRLKASDQLQIGVVTFVIQIDGVPADIEGIKPIEPQKEPQIEGDQEKVQEDHFDEFVEDLANAELSESHTTEIHDSLDNGFAPKEM